MTATSGQQLAVGARYAALFALDANGRPAASSTAAYEGVSFKGPKAFALTNPEPRKITHVGADRVLAVDFLPALEAAGAELRVPTENFDVDALLTAVLKFTLGESTGIVDLTDEQGYEPQVGLWLYQQALDRTSGLRRWRSIVIPKARVIPMPAGMSENAEDTRYMVAITPTSYHLWGEAMGAGTEGATEGQIVRLMSEYKPKLVAYLADGTEDEFLLPTDAPAQATAKMVVWVNGVERTTNLTKATTKITFTTSIPALNDNICVFYETV